MHGVMAPHARHNRRTADAVGVCYDPETGDHVGTRRPDRPERPGSDLQELIDADSNTLTMHDAEGRRLTVDRDDLVGIQP